MSNEDKWMIMDINKKVKIEIGWLYMDNFTVFESNNTNGNPNTLVVNHTRSWFFLNRGGYDSFPRKHDYKHVGLLRNLKETANYYKRIGYKELDRTEFNKKKKLKSFR